MLSSKTKNIDLALDGLIRFHLLLLIQLYPEILINVISLLANGTQALSIVLHSLAAKAPKESTERAIIMW